MSRVWQFPIRGRSVDRQCVLLPACAESEYSFFLIVPPRTCAAESCTAPNSLEVSLKPVSGAGRDDQSSVHGLARWGRNQRDRTVARVGPRAGVSGGVAQPPTFYCRRTSDVHPTPSHGAGCRCVQRDPNQQAFLASSPAVGVDRVRHLSRTLVHSANSSFCRSSP